MTHIMFQGDIAIRRINHTPQKMTDIPKEDGKVVVAHGEVSGHRHIVQDDSAVFFKATDNGKSGELYIGTLIASKPTEMTHDEHSAIPLPPGTYEISRQREAQITTNNESRSQLVTD